MATAIIKTGGKQYIVTEGEKLSVELLPEEAGKEITFDSVLLVEKDGKVQTGDPFVKGSKVGAKILSHGKGVKKNVLKFKNKIRYLVRRGHRQHFTEIEITKIG
jgi:large subunit ribosomal protein L21